MSDADLPGTCLCMTELTSCYLDVYDEQWLYQTLKDIHALRPGHVPNIERNMIHGLRFARCCNAFTVTNGTFTVTISTFDPPMRM